LAKAKVELDKKALAKKLYKAKRSITKIGLAVAEAAGQVILKEARDAIPVRFGFAREGLGIRTATYAGGDKAVAIVGPRAKLKFSGPEGPEMPSRYIHLAHSGFTTKDGKRVQGTPFMEIASRRAAGKLGQVIERVARDEVIEAFEGPDK
jgi:hypothetical protein